MKHKVNCAIYDPCPDVCDCGGVDKMVTLHNNMANFSILDLLIGVAGQMIARNHNKEDAQILMDIIYKMKIEEKDLTNE